MTDSRFGYRIVGRITGERRLVDADVALSAYARCEKSAEIDRESYLSAFSFGGDFKTYLQVHGTSKGYGGECWSSYLWIDIDYEGDVDRAILDARRVCSWVIDNFGYEPLLFFSGNKGFHLGISTSLWGPEPSINYNTYSKRLALTIENATDTKIDRSVYDKVRAFRAPNSRHPKTRLYKRFIRCDELGTLTAQKVVELASSPLAFELPKDPALNAYALELWGAAHAEPVIERVASSERSKLNQSTLDYIREGALVEQGDRHRLLFSAAANLAEFGCDFQLAYALLAEQALDSGLPPSDVKRQVASGLDHGGKANG